MGKGSRPKVPEFQPKGGCTLSLFLGMSFPGARIRVDVLDGSWLILELPLPEGAHK